MDGIELTFGADTRHVHGSPFDVANNTNLIERFHGTLKQRTKIMRRLKDIETARLFTQGWLLNYNYLRPHESLNGSTPARVAGVKYPYRSWQDIVAGRRVEAISQANAVSDIAVPELPAGTRYMIVRKRITKRPRRKKRGQKIHTSLSSVKA